jgi:hypothetical protein
MSSESGGTSDSATLSIWLPSTRENSKLVQIKIFRFTDQKPSLLSDRDITDLTPTIPNLGYVSDLAVELNSTRSITGPVQEEWMLDTIDDSLDRGTAWRLILNQVIFGTQVCRL